MMSNILFYKGYTTHVEYSTEDHILTGIIEGINDLVNFEADTPGEVEAAFHEAVDDYLAFCRDIGQEPERAYKGSFNVRIKPQLHRQLDIAARRQGLPLNQIVETALSEYMERNRPEEEIEESTTITIEDRAPVVLEMYRRQGTNVESPYQSSRVLVN